MKICSTRWRQEGKGSRSSSILSLPEPQARSRRRLALRLQTSDRWRRHLHALIGRRWLPPNGPVTPMKNGLLGVAGAALDGLQRNGLSGRPHGHQHGAAGEFGWGVGPSPVPLLSIQSPGSLVLRPHSPARLFLTLHNYPSPAGRGTMRGRGEGASKSAAYVGGRATSE